MTEAPVAQGIGPLLAAYRTQPELQRLAHTHTQAPQTTGAQGKGHAPKYILKGSTGSHSALCLGTLASLCGGHLLLLAPDREAALYLMNDIEVLFPDQALAWFPASGKRAYAIEKVDNANVLQRAQTLNLVQQSSRPLWIFSYAEALSEKVISHSALAQNTLQITVGESPGMDFLAEMLLGFGFAEVDFVQEPGQFAVRGGILDVFSYAHEKPVRIEFDDETIRGMRSFDVENQLSDNSVRQLWLVPNVMANWVEQERISLLEFLPPTTLLACSSVQGLLEESTKVFQRAELAWQGLLDESGGNTLRSGPESLFVPPDELERLLSNQTVLEWGAGQPYYKGSLKFEGKALPQTSFHKDYARLAEHLSGLQQQGYSIWLSAENDKQRARLFEILETHAPGLSAQWTNVPFSAGFEDPSLKLALYTDHEVFERYHKYREKGRYAKSQALSLRELTELQPGDYVTHINHGIGRFAGLEKVKVGAITQEAIKIVYRDHDVIYVSVNALYKLSKYAGKDAAAPSLNKLGTQEWARTKAKARKRMKELAFDLIALYAKRKAMPGFAFSADGFLQHEMEASFPYEETPDQLRATEDVKTDMEKPHPMDRLVCGDVGFGKTEVALRAAFKAAADGKQTAVLVPTTILALQHFQSFSARFGQFPVRVDYINRFRSAKEQAELLKELAEGKIDILIGTTRLLSKDVKFKNLGLLIIDEEHKFGVGAKEKLRLMRANVDTLAMTATPIPRTLQFSLLNIRDMSVIATPPSNRQPVETQLHVWDHAMLRDAIALELKRKGQVFFVTHRIKDLEGYASLIKDLVPDARVGIAHGQLDGDALEMVMTRFVAHYFDVLVCTTLIESGLDIPNANTIIINNAHFYGLSDLHQMRGRVGRSNKKAYCYLFAPPLNTLPSDSRKRLEAIEQFTDLGAGFQIALRDLDIRGAGDILGSEQSGFITEMGYDVYHRLLDEVISEIKEEFFPELLAQAADQAMEALPPGDCQMDLDIEAYLPDVYVPQVAERLSLYRRISEAKNEAQLQALARELQDRFGMLPPPTLALLDSIRLREAAVSLGFERIVFKKPELRCYYAADAGPSFFDRPVFQSVLAYLQNHPHDMRMKQNTGNLSIQISGINSLKQAVSRLREIVEQATEKVGV